MSDPKYTTNRFTHIYRGDVVTAMQLPKEDEAPSEELLDWLHHIEPEEGFFESGRNGSLVLYQSHGAEEAPPESWIISNNDGSVSYVFGEDFSSLYVEAPE